MGLTRFDGRLTRLEAGSGGRGGGAPCPACAARSGRLVVLKVGRGEMVLWVPSAAAADSTSAVARVRLPPCPVCGGRLEAVVVQRLSVISLDDL